MMVENMKVHAMVMCLTGEICRDVYRPGIHALHSASLVIAKDVDGNLIRWKDRYAHTQGDIVSSDQAERLVESHAAMVAFAV